MALLDRSEREEFLRSHPGWALDGETITRTFVLADFASAIGFVAAVGIVAERAFHHPDIDIRYRRVAVSLTTHDQGGLTRKDTSLASRIDRLASSR
ncbi:MAG: 4a-hydroxytetrahydrobiopterin dehydratase [bacterium]|nr:4a-hydroxytetrahydrobiopterin dehydratase [bacterium]